MGKASKWFRALLAPNPSTSSPTKPPKHKRRWTFLNSYRDHHATTPNTSRPVAEADNHHHHAVARSIASRGGGMAREEWAAATKIQAAFRGCLARRALRALKGLVKLQALVRGHIERKRTADWLQRMQSLLRASERVRAGRAQILQRAKSSAAHHHGPATPDKFESPIRSASVKYDQSLSVLKRNGSKSRMQIGNPAKSENRSDLAVNERSYNERRSWTRTRSIDDERSVRILEIDPGKPHISSKRRNLFYSTSQPLVSEYYSQSLTATKDSISHQSAQSQSSYEVQSYNSPLKINKVEDSSFCNADDDNSPQILSVSSKDCGSPFTPTRSDGSRSHLSNYSDYPSYMAYTESSKAKVRSLSVPKQRPQYERSCSVNRYSLHGIGESRLAAAQRVSALRASFTSKAYPGSGRLDSLGMPVGYRY